MQRPPVPGSLVWLRQRRWRVLHTQADRRVARLDVAGPTTRLTVVTPFDRPRLVTPDRRPVRVRRQQARARLAALVAAAPGARLPHTAVESRIELWPHQFEPVAAVLDGHRRLLIADEVGLGKTIQAGLILAELIHRQPMTTALVITPAGLCRQWRDELRRHFALEARTIDEDVDFAIATGSRETNPWRRPGLRIVSVDHLKQPHVLGGLPLDPWDVLVIDEAHTVTGASDRHEACDELGRRARRVILLSATPHDGDAARFARLVRLGALPCEGDTLTVFRRTRTDVRLPHGRVVRWCRVEPGPAFGRLLDTLGAFERALLAGTRAGTRDAALLLLAVFRTRALSTIAALDRSLARRLAWLDTPAGTDADAWRQQRLDFDDDGVGSDEDTAWTTADTGVPRARERAWIVRLRGAISAMRGRDPKLRRVHALLTRTTEPVVIFTGFRHSLDAVVQAIGTVRQVSAMHGAQPPTDRQHALDRFLAGATSVLVTTDVGGQGLNLQSRAHWLINLDLPWNPARLEQRIGRLDSLGQPTRVHATLLVAGHAVEQPLIASLSRRTHAAQQRLGSSTLADVTPPSPLALATTVIAGTTPAPPVRQPDMQVPLCHAYRRVGRACVTVVARRRRLRQHWHGLTTPGGRPTWTDAWFPCRPPLPVRGLAIVAVPLIDGTGDVIERGLIALGTADPWRDARDSHLLPAVVRAAVSRRVEVRLRRLRPWLRDVSIRRVVAERAIARHLYLVGHPRAAQLGLFSQRASTAFDEARRRAAIEATLAAARIRVEEARGVLTCGDPVIEWIGERS